MKSLSFLVITIFAIILTSILTACGQKDTKVIPSVSKTASF